MDEREQESGQGGERRFFSRPKICQFCADGHLVVDYKNTDMLRRFVTEEGKIRPRRQTGNCAKHQREVAGAVKRARHIALLPYVYEGRED
ncbi:MAG: 30S ribosomal protein S18 [Anaerolineae bacterium CG_4_9_14_3_um_filter_57_17]|nr:30S ribosomal protein S18 [bacterium]NCT19784.1 30S ribosomal protein S18 [bacterium]OIO85491.1 MAG: 30S ribosomal protein S18 [Anaerolineae bacterium CG2_30_57_67]PJB65699.1 MAG: 30S ribosomal protein S18 [Anaerolineae bacterium CG_4_9_14_3_um_filter_57_17]